MASRAGRVNKIVLDLGAPPPIPARSSEIVSAIVNLVVNAIDVMPDGGTITLRSGTRDQRHYDSSFERTEGVVNQIPQARASGNNGK